MVRNVVLSQMTKTLQNISKRIQKDITIKNGKWDMSAYRSDPQTPYPNGSSGFPYTLYIVTADGFVIERNQPITGYLDSSDIKKVLQYSSPQTIETITNEKWRVLSVPIKFKDKTEGAIFVSYYDPKPESSDKIDKILADSITNIQKKLTITDESINVRNIDIRDIHYEVSFEIINKYNIVLLNNGRTPSFIDPSYISKEINLQKEKKVIDQNTQHLNEVYVQPIYDNRKNIFGLIIVGESVNDINEIMQKFIVYSIAVNIVFIIPLILLSLFIIKRRLSEKLSKHLISMNDKPSSIAFNKKESYLEIDGIKLLIPYASNQYYICEAILLHPQKRWEEDELRTKFGEIEEAGKKRSVYDAMLAVNKKTNYKLIICKDRTYFFNKEYISALKE